MRSRCRRSNHRRRQRQGQWFEFCALEQPAGCGSCTDNFMTSFATLRGFVLKSQARTPEAGEHCDLCGSSVAHAHQHLIDPAARKLMCTCDACAVLFSQRGETKYKRAPRRARFLQDFAMSDAEGDSVLIPIGLAFFLKSSAEGRGIAMYPGVAGSAES